MSAGEETLAFHLKAAGIEFEREYRFAPPRRWRFDFIVGRRSDDGLWISNSEGKWEKFWAGIAVEVEGGAFSGGHKRFAAADTDTEKSNAAVIAGWRVLRFTTAQVEDGRALKTIEEALGRC